MLRIIAASEIAYSGNQTEIHSYNFFNFAFSRISNREKFSMICGFGFLFENSHNMSRSFIEIFSVEKNKVHIIIAYGLSS